MMTSPLTRTISFRNPKVQTKGLNLGFVQCLSRLLTNEVNQQMRLRLLFILSTLLRNFPDAQRTFIEHGGVETLTKVFEQTTTDSHNQIKIKLRVIQMINDLTIEEVRSTKKRRKTTSFSLYRCRITLRRTRSTLIQGMFIIPKEGRFHCLLIGEGESLDSLLRHETAGDIAQGSF